MGLIISTITGCLGVDGGHAFTSGNSSRMVRHQRAKRTHKQGPGRILFYEKGKPYYEFTNFSPHDVVYHGKRYPTSEHLFQALKFIDAHPHIAERIRTCSEKPMVAFDEAHMHQGLVRADWSHIHIDKMETALRLKFTQHAGLKRLLLGTGSAELVEDSPRDWFWGIGADGTGGNELGKALMRLRDEFGRNASNKSPHPKAARRARAGPRMAMQGLQA
ncbi:hypothetical protein F5141DRAFT_1209417 [Pisolithus sp. B1]|nr:hypothetical protein F5141DRAFT_1209417 [Pisolithus sp. B1]